MRYFWLKKLSENPDYTLPEFRSTKFDNQTTIEDHFYNKWNIMLNPTGTKSLSRPQYFTVLKISTTDQDLFDGISTYMEGTFDKKSGTKNSRSIWNLQFLMSSFTHEERLFAITKLNAGVTLEKVKKDILLLKKKRRLLEYGKCLSEENTTGFEAFKNNDLLITRLLEEYDHLLSKNYFLNDGNGSETIKKPIAVKQMENLTKDIENFFKNVSKLSTSQITMKIEDQVEALMIDETNKFYSYKKKRLIDDNRELECVYFTQIQDVCSMQFKAHDANLLFCDPPYNMDPEVVDEKNTYNPPFTQGDIENLMKVILNVNEKTVSKEFTTIIFTSITSVSFYIDIFKKLAKKIDYRLTPCCWSKVTPNTKMDVKAMNKNNFSRTFECFIVIEFGDKTNHRLEHQNFEELKLEEFKESILKDIQSEETLKTLNEKQLQSITTVVDKNFNNYLKKFDIFKGSDTFVYSNVKNKFKYDGDTLNYFQKNESLIKSLIRSFGKANISENTVLDFFSGSGTVAIACYDLFCKSCSSYEIDNRQFLGSFHRFKTHVEKNEKQSSNEEVIVIDKEKKGLPQNKKDGEKESEKIGLQNTCYTCGEENVQSSLLKLCDQKTNDKDHLQTPHYCHILNCSQKECPFFNDE